MATKYVELQSASESLKKIKTYLKKVGKTSYLYDETDSEFQSGRKNSILASNFETTEDICYITTKNVNSKPMKTYVDAANTSITATISESNIFCITNGESFTFNGTAIPFIAVPMTGSAGTISWPKVLPVNTYAYLVPGTTKAPNSYACSVLCGEENKYFLALGTSAAYPEKTSIDGIVQYKTLTALTTGATNPKADVAALFNGNYSKFNIGTMLKDFSKLSINQLFYMNNTLYGATRITFRIGYVKSFSLPSYTYKNYYVYGLMDLTSMFSKVERFVFHIPEVEDVKKTDTATSSGTSTSSTSSIPDYSPNPSMTNNNVPANDEDKTLMDLIKERTNNQSLYGDYLGENYSYLYSTSTNNPYVNVNSIVGMPFSFLSNTDIRYANIGNINTSINMAKNNTVYGKEFMDNIVYDMPIAVIKPGMPKHNTSSPLIDAIKNVLSDIVDGNGVRLGDDIIGALFTRHRFYEFDSAYATYIEYVNTLCHVFVTTLGIGDKIWKNNVKYVNYDDSYSKIENSAGQFANQFGTSPSVFVYYEPESTLSHTLGTQTTSPSIQASLDEYSETARNFGFSGRFLGMDTLVDFGERIGEVIAGIGKTKNILSAFGDIVSGQNIALPEIWSDSTSDASFGFKVKLVSPYGDPESVFLYVLRPLARLVALALPHQSSTDSYSQPFIIQAFSKGQFNCQMGIINSMSVSRGGNGGESHTMNHLPTEVEVSFTIKDMYETLMMSNEYVNHSIIPLTNLSMIEAVTAYSLLYSNIGMLDFIASYSGYSLNAPSEESRSSIIWNMFRNRANNTINLQNEGLNKLPSFQRKLYDFFNDNSVRAHTLIST